MFMRSHVYPVTATALSHTKVYSFRCKAFMNMLDAQPELYHTLLGNLAMRLRKQLQEIENLTMKNASYRVVNFFKNKLEEGDTIEDNVIRLNVQNSDCLTTLDSAGNALPYFGEPEKTGHC